MGCAPVCVRACLCVYVLVPVCVLFPISLFLCLCAYGLAKRFTPPGVEVLADPRAHGRPSPHRLYPKWGRQGLGTAAVPGHCGRGQLCGGG